MRGSDIDNEAIRHDPETDSYVVDISLDGPNAAADTVIYAVSFIRDRDPTELPPLANVVDTDAVSNVFRPETGESGNVQVSFDYAGFRITIFDHGEIHLVEGM